MVTQLRDLKKKFGYASAFLTFVFALVVGMPYWIHVTGGRMIGMFASSNSGTDATYKTVCSAEFTEMECGYLHSSRISSVVSIIFGGLSTIVYFLPPNIFSALPTFCALLGSTFQMIFAVIAGVLWYYFKKDYYDDDGVNREYATTGSEDLTFSVAFYIWIVGAFFSIVLCATGFFLLFKCGKSFDADANKI